MTYCICFHLLVFAFNTRAMCLLFSRSHLSAILPPMHPPPLRLDLNYLLCAEIVRVHVSKCLWVLCRVSMQCRSFERHLENPQICIECAMGPGWDGQLFTLDSMFTSSCPYSLDLMISRLLDPMLCLLNLCELYWAVLQINIPSWKHPLFMDERLILPWKFWSPVDLGLWIEPSWIMGEGNIFFDACFIWILKTAGLQLLGLIFGTHYWHVIDCIPYCLAWPQGDLWTCPSNYWY